LGIQPCTGLGGIRALLESYFLTNM
jgi:hypothetical protein